MPVVCLLVTLWLGSNQSSLFEKLYTQGKEQLKQAKHAQAAKTFRAAVLEAEREDIDDVLLAVTFNDLAQAHTGLREYTEAESLYKRAIHILRSASDRWRLVVVLNNLGRLYREMGLDLRSAGSYAEASDLAKSASMENTPLVAAALGGLADGRTVQGDLKGAERYLRQALKIREAALGPVHLDVAESLNNLGVIYAQRKQLEKAESAFRRSLEITQKLLGPDHTDLAVTLDSLGVLYYEQDRYTEAEKLLRRSFEIRKKHLPGDHPAIARNLTHLAHVMIRLERSAEAEGLLREAVAIRGRHPPGFDSEMAITLESYAIALKLNGRPAEALAIESQARSLRAKSRYVVRR